MTVWLQSLGMCVSQDSRVCHLRARSNMMWINHVTRTACAAAATVTAVSRHRTITTQHCIHRATSDGTITWHWTTGSHSSRHLQGLANWAHFEAVYIQVVAHLATDFHRKVQQVCTAEYLQTNLLVCQHFTKCSSSSSQLTGLC